MSTYDLPAMIDFALTKSGKKKLYYVGHSEGTLTMFAQAEIQDKVQCITFILHTHTKIY